MTSTTTISDSAEINFNEDVSTEIFQDRTFGPQAADSGPVSVIISCTNENEVTLIGDRETVAQYLRELARNLEAVGKATWETTITIG